MELQQVIQDVEAFVRSLQRASDTLRGEGKTCQAARVEMVAVNLRSGIGDLEELLEAPNGGPP